MLLAWLSPKSLLLPWCIQNGALSQPLTNTGWKFPTRPFVSSRHTSWCYQLSTEQLGEPVPHSQSQTPGRPGSSLQAALRNARKTSFHKTCFLAPPHHPGGIPWLQGRQPGQLLIDRLPGEEAGRRPTSPRPLLAADATSQCVAQEVRLQAGPSTGRAQVTDLASQSSWRSLSCLPPTLVATI